VKKKKLTNREFDCFVFFYFKNSGDNWASREQKDNFDYKISLISAVLPRINEITFFLFLALSEAHIIIQPI